MSDAIKALRDYLSKSPSVVYPQDVLEYLPAIEEENAQLRELVKRMHRHIRQTCGECDGWYCSNFDEDNECCVYDALARELGVEP